MPENLNAEQLKKLLTDPEGAVDLSDEQLDEALHALIGLSGSMADPTLLEQLKPLYRHAVTRLHPAMRLRNYQTMVDRVIDGAMNARSLLPYMVCDDDRTLVSMATLDYALLAPEKEDAPTAAAEFLLDAYQHGAFANGPAVLAGLLLSGDRRLLVLLAPICRSLPCEDVEEMIQCQGSFLMAAVVEFYLDWLEQLDSLVEEDLFGAVAAGLANLVLGEHDGIVYDIERVIPSTRENAVQLIGQWTLAEYAAIIAPRMQELADKEQGEAIMPEVLSIWLTGG